MMNTAKKNKTFVWTEPCGEENLMKKQKKHHPRKMFIDTIIHELPHASDKVHFHPEFDPYSKESLVKKLMKDWETIKFDMKNI